MAIISTASMTYNKQNSTLSAEASDFRGAFIPGSPRVTVESHRTGAQIPFHLVSTKEDEEGDIMFWVYTPKFHRPGVARLIMFND